MRSLRAIAIAAMAVLLGLGTATLAAAPAAAAAGDMTCLGTSSVTYSPGLTNTTANVTVNITVTLSSCTSIPRSDITSGSLTRSGTFPQSCSTALVQGTGGSMTTTWNTSETSTESVTNTGVQAQGLTSVATQTGSVTAGLFTGDSYTLASVFLNSDISLGCLAPGGLTSLSGISTLVIA